MRSALNEMRQAVVVCGRKEERKKIGWSGMVFVWLE
jgi:hypothetical protein